MVDLSNYLLSVYSAETLQETVADEIHEEKQLQADVDDVERRPPSTDFVRRHHHVGKTTVSIQTHLTAC